MSYGVYSLETLKVLWTDLTGVAETTYERLLLQLPDARRDYATHYKLAEDRQRSIAAGALLQLAMDRAGVSDRKLVTGPQGKPLLDGAADFHFSLSHSGSIVLCAYGSSPMGADVEEPGRPLPKIVQRKCPPGEWQWLQAQPDLNAAFFRLWVLKEAYVKALGTGLTLGLDQYEIQFSDTVRVSRNGCVEPWIFHEASLNSYPAVVCCKASTCDWEQVRF